MHDTIKNRIFFIFLLLSVAVLVATLYKRQITFDEAFFAEQAYWVNKVGYSRTELFNDILDWSGRQYVYHKLLVWQTAIILKYFGWSPYLFKVASLVYLFIFIYFAHIYYKRYLSPDNTESFLLFLALLLLNTYIVQLSFESRPEIMMMCVGFLSFLTLRHGVKLEKKSYLFLSGLLAGIAVLFHLNGIIYIAAGIMLIIFMRQYRYIAIFTLSAIIVSSLYWLEMITNNTISIGITQLINDPAVVKDEPSVLNLIFKFLSSPLRFVSHIFDFSYILLLILTLYLSRHTLKTNYEVKLLLVYFVTSEICLALINPGAKTMYLVLHMPFVLLVVTSLQNTLNNAQINKTMLIAFSFYAITQTGHVYGLTKHSNSDIMVQHAHIIKKYHIEPSDRIIAPALFVFNEIESAKISSTEMLNMLAQSGRLTFNSQGVFSYANAHNYKYLILRNNFLPEFTNTNLVLNKQYLNYHLIGEDYGYYIFRQIS